MNRNCPLTLSCLVMLPAFQRFWDMVPYSLNSLDFFSAQRYQFQLVLFSFPFRVFNLVVDVNSM